MKSNKETTRRKIKNTIRKKFNISEDFLNLIKFIYPASEKVSNKLGKAYPNTKIKITGYPRNDILFDKEMSLMTLLANLN